MITSPDVDEAVRHLAREHPDWLPVLDAAVAVAERAEALDGVFAGAWVVDELARRGQGRRVPNLRLLASYGLVEKFGRTSRGGRRAYYRMPARLSVAEAVRSWREQNRRTLQFVGAGASAEPAGDTARQAADMCFEPPQWR